MVYICGYTGTNCGLFPNAGIQLFCSTMLNQSLSLVFGVYVRVEKYMLSA